MFDSILTWWRRPAYAIDALEPNQLDQQNLTRALARDMLEDRRAERRVRLAKPVLYVALFLAPLLVLGLPSSSLDVRPSPSEDVVGVVSLDGEMIDGNRASADRIIPALRRAFESKHVRAVVLSIDSPGGAPLEAERIYSAIDSWRKTHPKPVIAVITAASDASRSQTRHLSASLSNAAISVR